MKNEKLLKLIEETLKNKVPLKEAELNKENIKGEDLYKIEKLVDELQDISYAADVALGNVIDFWKKEGNKLVTTSDFNKIKNLLADTMKALEKSRAEIDEIEL